MKYLAVALCSLFLAGLTLASELELKSVYLPLFIQHGVVNEGDETVQEHPREITFVSRGAEPETTFAMLMKPHIPAHDSTWAKKGDSNLISLCSVRITHEVKATDSGGELVVTLDLTRFKKPEAVSMTESDVIQLIRAAILQNFGKVEINQNSAKQDEEP